MKGQRSKTRIHKDLSFLLSITPVEISPSTVKYLLAEGFDAVLSTITNPFVAHCSSTKYDYSGRLISAKSLALRSTETSVIKEAVFSMKIGERAWFNIQDESGCHHEIILESVQFKNAENMAARRQVIEQNRNKGKHLFEAGQYQMAFRVYRSSANISETYPKNRYTDDQVREIREMNLKAKQNAIRSYLRCANGDQFAATAAAYVEFLVKHSPHDPLTPYLKAKYQFKSRYFGDALQTARKAYEANNGSEMRGLIAQIEGEIARKTK